MTNFQVYKKTLSYSLLMFLVGMVSLLVMAATMTAGYFIAEQSGYALVGLAIGFVVGIILIILINIFVNNRIKAAQIAMMTKGVTEGSLPEHTFKEGFNEIKGRFGKITAFFFVTSAIKGIFRQLGRALTGAGKAIGGQVGESVTSAIDSAIQVLIGYLCDCCLGWILYRQDVNTAKAGCEGAVIFFKHGKTLLRNIGRIFGLGLASFLLVGGAFTGVFYLVFNQFPAMFNSLSTTIYQFLESGEGDISPLMYDPQFLKLYISLIFGIILWSTFHGVLVRPFILVGVLRNYMAAGQQDIPTEADFAELDSKSPRFAKLHNGI